VQNETMWKSIFTLVSFSALLNFTHKCRSDQQLWNVLLLSVYWLHYNEGVS